ncbi:MAG TPA: tetraacyldisaccharide 4'-kinase [Ohtaekwangia sp.]
MVILQIVLFPFSVLYKIVTALRNKLYDIGLRPSVQFDVPVINVGNLTVGGTGKTPLIEHLIRLLGKSYSIATLSRGYGRETKGFRIAGPSDNASTLGDEPYQFYRKFSDSITVSVGEDRAFAIPNILQAKDTQVVLLDDAFQHRRVRPSFNIMLTDYNRLFYNDFLLPAGRLRESRYGARRADVIIVTKCPVEITGEKMIKIEHSIRRYAEKPVFFSKIRYGSPTPFGSVTTLADEILLVTGIGNAKPLKDHVRQAYKLVDHFEFADHHKYSVSDLERILSFVRSRPSVSILTTEKDWVKLDHEDFKSTIEKLPVFYLPIEVEFIKNGEDFDAMILNVVQRA